MFIYVHATIMSTSFPFQRFDFYSYRNRHFYENNLNFSNVLARPLKSFFKQMGIEYNNQLGDVHMPKTGPEKNWSVICCALVCAPLFTLLWHVDQETSLNTHSKKWQNIRKLTERGLSVPLSEMLQPGYSGPL